MSQLTITGGEFESKVLNADTPVMVDFYADWCGPCKMIAPFVEEIAAQYAGRAGVYKLNTDDNPAIAMKYNVRSIPNVLFFKNGALCDQVIGAGAKENYTSVLEKWL